MVDSRRSNCKKLKAVAVIVVVVMIISFLLYFLLPAREEKQEVEEKNNQNGDNNKVTTIEHKEVSLVHVEGLQKGQTTGNLLTILGSVPKWTVYGRARPSRRAFVENSPSKARIFVVLPVYM